MKTNIARKPESRITGRPKTADAAPPKGDAIVSGVVFQPARKPPRAFEEIITQINRLIVSGRIKRGQKLPTERQLAAQFQVGRNTVREALRMLEISGAIVLRRGPKGGAFVASDGQNVLNQQLTNALRLTDFSISDLTEAMRRVTVMLFEAAERAVTVEDLDAMEANIREAETTEDPYQRSATLIQFYNLLAAASGNKILVLIANLLVEILQKWVARMGPVNPQFVISSRRSIVRHLRLGDADSAFAELRIFLDRLHDYWLNGPVGIADELEADGEPPPRPSRKRPRSGA